MTKQRKLIRDVIRSSTEHLTAKEIYKEAKKHLPSIAMGTVYRNLKIMEQAGEIRKLHIPSCPDRYDKSCMPHEHIRCIRCGGLQDLPSTDLKEYLSKKFGYSVYSYELQITYICPQCKNLNI